MIHLDSLLSHSPKSNSFAERVDWLVSVFTWLRHPAARGEEKIAWERTMSVRLKYLLKVLNQNPEWKQTFLSTLSKALIDMSGVNLFARAGLSTHPSFISDLIGRFLEKILPQAPFDEDLPSFLREIFPEEEDSVLVAALDEEVMAQVVALFKDDAALVEHMRRELVQTTEILATQILHSTLFYSTRVATHVEPIMSWPEKRLLMWTDVLERDPSQVSAEQFRSLLEECRQAINTAQARFSEVGISVDQVYLLKQRRRWLDRLEIVVDLLFEDKVRDRKIRSFISQLILDLHQSRSFSYFIKDNLALLSQRIVQRNSEVGEHYVTYDWKQFRHMLMSAGGGGAVTSFTVFMKILLSKLHTAGFIQGLLDGTNYAASFLLIQFSGFTLATKQPSATAPYLAQKLKLSLGEARKAIIALLRTQFIAVTGNVLFVIPLCFSVIWFSHWMGVDLMTPEKAKGIIESTDILGPTPIYGIFTGFLLFSASLIAGWFENWVLLHRLPERMTNNLVGVRWFGRWRIKLADLLKTKSNAIAANVSLGFLLGLAPQFLYFLGIPLEARHITLSTGSFAAALPIAMEMGLGTDIYVRAILGIVLIAFLNVGVSFGLAFLLAAYSSGVRLHTFFSLVRWSIGLVITKPWLLIVPEKNEPKKSHNHH
mgnify:CR=1 FL=1